MNIYLQKYIENMHIKLNKAEDEDVRTAGCEFVMIGVGMGGS